MATAHIEANMEDIAPIVLTSGDPKRCEYIAKTYLKDIKLLNNLYQKEKAKVNKTLNIIGAYTINSSNVIKYMNLIETTLRGDK